MRNRGWSRCFWPSTAIAIMMLVGEAQAARPPRRHAWYPLRCAGIEVGETTDEQVRRLYGRGLFVGDEGHLGGRYFIDPKHRLTLHIVLGVDQIVDTVEYERGMHPPAKHVRPGTLPKVAVSSRVTSNKQVQYGIRLGDSPKALLRRFGRPAKDTGGHQRRVIRYEADLTTMRNVLDYEAEFRFVGDRLIGVMLYNGE